MIEIENNVIGKGNIGIANNHIYSICKKYHVYHHHKQWLDQSVSIVVDVELLLHYLW